MWKVENEEKSQEKVVKNNEKGKNRLFFEREIAVQIRYKEKNYEENENG